MEPASNPDECSSQINVQLGRNEKALAAASFEVCCEKPCFVAKLIGPHLPLLEGSVFCVGVIRPALDRATNGGWLNVSHLLDVVQYLTVSPNLNLMTQSHAEPWRTPASNYFSIGSCQRDDPPTTAEDSQIYGGLQWNRHRILMSAALG
ncbi:hypothetical protein CEXT_331121 [Caerostris extrusa]|uniref:Uncharacterized protein n=1 Tax=Caerostris extrusa TaxID=172846 RepID=A0AAV4QJG7_CAEEX|nr:hypothetical protein CEXT_331121 [Caerostris extrusa]